MLKLEESGCKRLLSCIFPTVAKYGFSIRAANLNSVSFFLALSSSSSTGIAEAPVPPNIEPATTTKSLSFILESCSAHVSLFLRISFTTKVPIEVCP